jgi:hypothetical protein
MKLYKLIAQKFEPLYQIFEAEDGGEEFDLDDMNKKRDRIQAIVDERMSPYGNIASVLFVASQSSPDKLVFLITVKHDVPAEFHQESKCRCTVTPSLAHGFCVKIGIGVGCIAFNDSGSKAKRFLTAALGQEVADASW